MSLCYNLLYPDIIDLKYKDSDCELFISFCGQSTTEWNNTNEKYTCPKGLLKDRINRKELLN